MVKGQAGSIRLKGSLQLGPFAVLKRPALAGTNQLLHLFGKVVKEIMSPQQSTQTSDLAELYTQRKIDNAFAIVVNMKILSNQTGQSFELRTYHDQNKNSGYLVKFLNEKKQSLALIRFDRSGSSVIDITRQEEIIRQNEPQALSWMRYADGEMKVMIGDKEVLNTRQHVQEI